MQWALRIILLFGCVFRWSHSLDYSHVLRWVDGCRVSRSRLLGAASGVSAVRVCVLARRRLLIGICVHRVRIRGRMADGKREREKLYIIVEDIAYVYIATTCA